ncbi:MAG: sigma-54-dependent Fis family transcriptional regulator [Polyangiaceae bacterium]
MIEGVDDRVEERLHAAEIESLERRLLDLALEQTSAHDGAIFLWDRKRKGLSVDFHVVGGVAVNIPGMLLKERRDGRPNGIALHTFLKNEPYLTNDTRTDPNYAPYFQEVRSIAAVPIPYQGKAIGVIATSSRQAEAFSEQHLEQLASLAATSAKFLRRAQLYRASSEDDGRPFLIKGLSPAWLRVERQIERVSPTQAPVLIHGESGTGKELTAHAIHFNSRRAGGPFVAVNSAAIPDTLLESVLFGHVKGAFTGATDSHVGELEKADGGTLFLDEMGELPLPLQAKILRAIETGEVQPLGSNKAPKRVNVRIVCATNRDLPAMIRSGGFRDDLYYRISVVTLELPPLREYKDNLETLSRVFLQQAALRHDKKAPRLTPVFLAALSSYDFPGNVRELKNCIEHAVIMARGEELAVEDLPPSVLAGSSVASVPSLARPQRRSLKAMREEWLADPETRYLREILDEAGGNVARAAELAEVNMVTLYRLLKKRGIVLRRRAELR